MSLRIVIAGGGTGGHIFPAIAIAHAIRRISPGADILFVGAQGKMEMEKVPQEGFKIVGLPIAGFNRSHFWKNLSLPFKLARSYFMARKILRRMKPDIVVGVGGYASFPMLRAAQARRVATLVQEQNSFAGKSNKILARRATVVCVAYEDMERFFPKEKVRILGNPVRKAIAESALSSEEGRAFFDIQGEGPVVLVVGGSLGAQSINQAVGAGLKEILAEGVTLLWQTGKPYFETAKQQAAAFGSRVVVRDFIQHMDAAYAAADVIISRAGALAIAELSIVGKPVIFVPYPYAAEDHQTSNAMALVRHNAAELVRDPDAAAELVPKLKKLLHDEAAQSIMRTALKQLAIRDADHNIAEEIIATALESRPVTAKYINNG
jgi:UDP-N-acetylglucosamine--N-acetylmuramyl-(pentapeptide) pyrophosphoryl-undecaprenol N-acetylglucosamine transferase